MDKLYHNVRSGWCGLKKINVFDHSEIELIVYRWTKHIELRHYDICALEVCSLLQNKLKMQMNGQIEINHKRVSILIINTRIKLCLFKDRYQLN